MGLCLRLTPRLEQRLVLHLVQKIEVPDDWDFKEPEPMTPVRHDMGTYVCIPEEDIASYAAGCRKVAGIIEKENPSMVLISLRGGKPVSRCVEQFLENEYHAVEAKTSYFLKDLSGKMNKALRSCRKNGEFGKVLMLDTSVSGTKLSWFMPQVLGNLADSTDCRMDFVTAVLWHNRDGWYEETGETYGPVTNRNYNVGVRNLVCEDNPTLLGVHYDDVCDHCEKRAKSKVKAYEKPEESSIHVLRGDDRTVYPVELYGGTVSTADLFIMLVKEYAQRV